MHTGCMKASRTSSLEKCGALTTQQHTLHSCLFLKAEFLFTLPGLCDALLMHYSQNPCRRWFYRVGCTPEAGFSLWDGCWQGMRGLGYSAAPEQVRTGLSTHVRFGLNQSHDTVSPRSPNKGC